MAIGPAPILALLLGGFHTALFVFLRARAGVRIAIVFAAAALGAWAGDALGGRTGVDPIRIGDFHVITASVVAWAAIAFVAVLSILGPVERRLRSCSESYGASSSGGARPTAPRIPVCWRSRGAWRLERSSGRR